MVFVNASRFPLVLGPLLTSLLCQLVATETSLDKINTLLFNPAVSTWLPFCILRALR
ncbi:MAG: hypothetical protein ACI9CP_001751 [Cryomorphaceae bacterium]|jgi:hypothetical protein